ncbi:MAG: hypothetical protein IJT82_04690, partial [Schwartzia sp.]|nr:hypothetical protein [Schwartzia sp. (in: firmicutes)]
VKSWFTLLWNDPRAALEVFINMVKSKFSNLYQYVAEKWEKLKYILSNPINAAVNFVEHGNVHGSMTHESTGMSANDIRGIDENALGGIYKRPHLTWVAEAGSPEAIVPLDGSRRAFSLWQKAGEMLGAFPPADASDDSHSGEGLLQKALGLLGVGRDTAPSVNIENSAQPPAPASTFSAPPITINLTINGDTSPREVERAVINAGHEVQASFTEQFAAMMHERWRTSYA